MCGPASVHKTTFVSQSYAFGVAFISRQCLKEKLYHTPALPILQVFVGCLCSKTSLFLQQELETFSLLSNGTSINLSNQVQLASSSY